MKVSTHIGLDVLAGKIRLPHGCYEMDQISDVAVALDQAGKAPPSIGS